MPPCDMAIRSGELCLKIRIHSHTRLPQLRACILVTSLRGGVMPHSPPTAPCCQPEVVIWASNRQLFFFAVFFFLFFVTEKSSSLFFLFGNCFYLLPLLLSLPSLFSSSLSITCKMKIVITCKGN